MLLCIQGVSERMVRLTLSVSLGESLSSYRTTILLHGPLLDGCALAISYAEQSKFTAQYNSYMSASMSQLKLIPGFPTK